MEYLDLSWRSALLLALVVPSTLIAVRLCFRQVETRANRVLAAFIIILNSNLIPQIIGFSGFYQQFPWLTFAPFNNEMWLGPLILLHVALLTKQPLGKRQNWLFAPAIIQTSYYFVTFVSMPDYRNKWAYSESFHVPYITPVETLLTVIISLYCFVKAWQMVTRYRKALVNVQSDLDAFDTKWLEQFFASLTVLIVIWTLFDTYHVAVHSISYPNQLPFHVLFAGIGFWLAIQALAHMQNPFPEVEQKRVAHSTDMGQLLQLYNSIEEGMQRHQWYLTPRLGVSDIARKVGSNESYVSKAINAHEGINFNRYVNNARVQYASQLLSKQGIDEAEQNILEIALASGFSSKASFNRNFKACFQCTPSEFLNSQNSLDAA